MVANSKSILGSKLAEKYLLENIRFDKLPLLGTPSSGDHSQKKGIPGKGGFNDFGFHGPPTPSGQGLCGFDKWRSPVVK